MVEGNVHPHEILKWKYRLKKKKRQENQKSSRCQACIGSPLRFLLPLWKNTLLNNVFLLPRRSTAKMSPCRFLLSVGRVTPTGRGCFARRAPYDCLLAAVSFTRDRGCLNWDPRRYLAWLLFLERLTAVEERYYR